MRLTLIEVAVALAITVLVMAGMFGVHDGLAPGAIRLLLPGGQRHGDETNGAHRASQWVISGMSVTNIFNSSLTTVQTNALGMPSNGTNLVYATNYASVTQISTNPRM